ncbi:MAG: hypothetical protein J0I06_00645 [Planctomycetes bacterium]|nr:hypothetical protein [Planctomycetota bacterium]
MTRHAREAVSLCAAAAIGESALLALVTTDWSNVGAQALLFAFLVGPALFLALLVWRRRAHEQRSRVLFVVTAAVAAGGLAVLGHDLYRFNTDPLFRRQPNMNGVLVPIVQWCVAGAVWVWLVVVETREKRQARQPPRSTEAPRRPDPTNPRQSAS